MEDSTKPEYEEQLAKMQEKIYDVKYPALMLEDTTPTVVDFFQFDKDFWGVAVRMLVLLISWMVLSSSSCLVVIWAMTNHAIVLPVLQMLFAIVGASLIGVILVTAGYLLFKLSIKLLRGKKCT